VQAFKSNNLVKEHPMARVPRSEETRKRLGELFEGEFDRSELMREALKLVIDEALEAEVTEALNRGY
jgi:hypothetical protein